MSNYIVSDTDLTSVANAIRTKGGTSAQLAFPAEFVSAIADIPSGGGSNIVEGTFTGTGARTVTITHNLNSKNVIVFISVDSTGLDTIINQGSINTYKGLTLGYGFGFCDSIAPVGRVYRNGAQNNTVMSSWSNDENSVTFTHTAYTFVNGIDYHYVVAPWGGLT